MAPRAGLTTERVVVAAADLADRDGLEALTLAAVADHVGVRTPSLYNHVGGLDDLHRRLTLHSLELLEGTLREAVVGRSGDAAVRALGTAYRWFGAAHPGLYPTVVPSAHGDEPEIRRVADRMMGTVRTVLGAYGLSGDEAVHAARTLRSALHGFVSLEQTGGFGLPADVDDSFQRLLDTLVAGLRAGAAISGPAGRAG